MASWASMITRYRKNIWSIVNHSGEFWGGGVEHRSGPVKITPGEWILRVTRQNGKCCQNLVSNIDNDV